MDGAYNDQQSTTAISLPLDLSNQWQALTHWLIPGGSLFAPIEGIALGRVKCHGVFSQLKKCRVRNTAVRQVDCVSPKAEAGQGHWALSDPGSGPLFEKPDPSKWGSRCGSKYPLRPGLTVHTQTVTV